MFFSFLFPFNDFLTNPSVGIVDQEVELAGLLLLDPLEQLLHLDDDHDDHDYYDDDHDDHGTRGCSRTHRRRRGGCCGCRRGRRPPLRLRGLASLDC